MFGMKALKATNGPILRQQEQEIQETYEASGRGQYPVECKKAKKKAKRKVKKKA